MQVILRSIFAKPVLSGLLFQRAHFQAVQGTSAEKVESDWRKRLHGGSHHRRYPSRTPCAPQKLPPGNSSNIDSGKLPETKAPSAGSDSVRISPCSFPLWWRNSPSTSADSFDSRSNRGSNWPPRICFSESNSRFIKSARQSVERRQ
jgi:hypothetical protein